MIRKTLYRNTLCIGVTMLCFGIAAEAGASQVDLDSAANFAVLGASTVTNTGMTTLDGDLGVWAGSAITGFYGTNENDGPGTFTGSSHQADSVAQQASADALAAYIYLSAMVVDQDLTGQDLGGLTLTPGVYNFSSSAFLTGTLTLDGQGDYVFLMGSTLVTASNSFVNCINGANPYSEVFWRVGSSATLGTGTSFSGTIIAQASNTLTTGASLQGRVIALVGAVTLDNNNIVAMSGPGGGGCNEDALGDIAPFPKGDGSVNIYDLLLCLNAWSTDGIDGGDSNCDGTVNVDDLLEVINNWS
jgi:hypothetical protein